jgi:hypothetical protein
MPTIYIITMAYSNIPSITSKLSPAKIYGDAGLIYIIYHAQIETKPNGHNNISGSRPAFSKIKEQINYSSNSGDYYSLLMGREFKPGRWSILLDFDNKDDETSHNGLELFEKLNMDQYNAPKQNTPSGGYHYIFYVDAQQKEHINSRTTITYQGVTYNMDVKFKNGLRNCAPSKIQDYGKYAWTKGSAERLKNTPKLPDELFEMIKVAFTHNKQPPLQGAQGSLRRPQTKQQPPPPPPPRSCRISRLSVVASPYPSWPTTPLGSE